MSKTREDYRAEGVLKMIKGGLIMAVGLGVLELVASSEQGIHGPLGSFIEIMSVGVGCYGGMEFSTGLLTYRWLGHSKNK